MQLWHFRYRSFRMHCRFGSGGALALVSLARIRMTCAAMALPSSGAAAMALVISLAAASKQDSSCLAAFDACKCPTACSALLPMLIAFWAGIASLTDGVVIKMNSSPSKSLQQLMAGASDIPPGWLSLSLNPNPRVINSPRDSSGRNSLYLVGRPLSCAFQAAHSQSSFSIAELPPKGKGVGRL